MNLLISFFIKLIALFSAVLVLLTGYAIQANAQVTMGTKDFSGSDDDEVPSRLVVSESKINKDEIQTTIIIDFKKRIAVLPVQNLSGSRAPIGTINQVLTDSIQKKGANLLEKKAMTSFIFRHRLRNTGSVNQNISRAFKEEENVDALLVTVLELYERSDSPKISLISRLVLTGDTPKIIWMDNVSLTGDQSPGFLDLGVVSDPNELMETALHSMAESFIEFLFSLTARDEVTAGTDSISENNTVAQNKEPAAKKYLPKTYYRSPLLFSKKTYTIAVTPFYNLTERRYAEELVTLHFIMNLLQRTKFTVIEPGVIRHHFLRYRTIMQDGLSLANVDLLFSKLDCDLILTGKILDYLDYQGPKGIPQVDFSVIVFERKSRQIVWSSKSYNDGDEGVFFFELGKKHTANKLASEMTKSIVNLMMEN